MFLLEERVNFFSALKTRIGCLLCKKVTDNLLTFSNAIADATPGNEKWDLEDLRQKP